MHQNKNETKIATKQQVANELHRQNKNRGKITKLKTQQKSNSLCSQCCRQAEYTACGMHAGETERGSPTTKSPYFHFQYCLPFYYNYSCLLSLLITNSNSNSQEQQKKQQQQ